MKPKEQFRRWAPALLQVGLTVALLAMTWFLFPPTLQSNLVQRVSYSDFVQTVREGRVQAAQISTAEIQGTLRPQSGKTQSAQPQNIVAVRPPNLEDPELLPLLRQKNVQIVGKLDTPNWWGSLLVSAFPILLLIGFWVWITRKMGRGGEALQFGRLRAKIYNRAEREKVTFADVAGVDEAKAELLEIVDFLQSPEM